MAALILPKRGFVLPKRHLDEDQDDLPEPKRCHVDGEVTLLRADMIAQFDPSYEKLKIKHYQEKNTNATANGATDVTGKQDIRDMTPRAPTDYGTDKLDDDVTERSDCDAYEDNTTNSDEDDSIILMNTEDDETTSLRLQFDRLTLLDYKFPQFGKLPPEIRQMIWECTWEYRTVFVDRHIIGTDSREFYDLQYNDGYGDGGREMRGDFNFHILWRWGDPGLGDERPDPTWDTYLVTLTRSRSIKPPVSLWVNQESRRETLQKYSLAFRLAGGRSTIYFNFERDMLYFSLHSPLSAAFLQKDLSQLTRISIPELGPMVYSFAQRMEPWFLELTELPRRDADDDRYTYPEFKEVWILLRRWFPALREITVQPFYECDCYNVTRINNYGLPIRVEAHEMFDIPDFDDFCYSCFNIQDTVDHSYPPLDTSHRSIRNDINRIMDFEGISHPVHVEEILVIGNAPPTKRGQKDEDVVVRYYSVHDGEPDTYVPSTEEEEVVDWELVKRQMVAKTLQRAFGRPDVYDQVVLRM
ncbi:hypothetical protein F4810DRAFT_676220 [Camillea tinctor]|nr:hypothetical protein F4810DRAFT_676220 [Camillea tinctor]